MRRSERLPHLLDPAESHVQEHETLVGEGDKQGLVFVPTHDPLQRQSSWKQYECEVSYRIFMTPHVLIGT